MILEHIFTCYASERSGDKKMYLVTLWDSQSSGEGIKVSISHVKSPLSLKYLRTSGAGKKRP
jgi:hypothetical protein